MDQELVSQLPALRGRSREVCMNNPFGKQFLQKVRQNVVGPEGFRYQARARRADGTLDEGDNKLLESAWRMSGEAGNFEVTGKMARADGERSLIDTVARDGEALLRYVRGYDNEVGFAVEFLSPERLDWSLNVAELRSGNRVVMGVELDGFNKPVAFYITSRGSTASFSGETMFADRVRVPASDLLHLYLPLRVDATRGVPWMHAAMVELHHLGGYKEAAVVAARIGANKLGWIRGGDADPLTGDGEDTEGNRIMEAEPGTFGQLPEDADILSWDPEYPHAQFPEFNKAMLQGISSGIGVAYNSFANDLEGVSFSSMRSGVQEERDAWMCIQAWMVSCYAKRTHREWLAYSLVSRRIPELATLPAAKYDKFKACLFQPRRWQWVDPLKDSQANQLGLDNATMSRSDIIRQRGLDPTEVWDEIAAENALMKAKGIEIVPAAQPSQGAEQVPVDIEE